MITLKNTDSQTLTWYALPKYSIDITKALKQGTLPANSQTTYNPPTTVNVLFALAGNQFAALGIAGQGTTVTFYNQGPGTWCVVV